MLACWRRTAASFAAIGPEIDTLFDVGADLLAGGKRLRAAFAAAGWRSAGGEPVAEAEVRLGSGLELFQMAALVHDDLMDGSSTRRGRPAAHCQLATLHGATGLVGDANRFASAGAILLGDLLLVTATAELGAAVALGGSDDARTRTRALVDEMMAEVTIGQYLDIYAQSADWSEDPAVDLDRARRVIRAKSARYSVEHPLVIGAALGGAGDDLQSRLSAVGLPLGEAFQLRDDVLGVFGDPDTTGKPAGDDLREGKRTVLVAHLLDAAGDEPEVGTFFAERFGHADLREDEVERIRVLARESGAVDAVEACIAKGAQRARAALDGVRSQVPADAYAALEAFIESTTARTF